MNTQAYDFPVALRPVFDEDGQEIPKHKHIVRTDVTPKKSFGVVSNIYRLIPHAQVEESLRPLMERLGAEPQIGRTVEKDGGRLILKYTFRNIMLSLPGHRIPGQEQVGDAVAMRVYAKNSYLKDSSLTIQVGALVLRCLNGATAIDGLFNLNVRHVGEERPLDLPHPDVLINAFTQTGAVWRRWAEQGLIPELRREFIDAAKRSGILSERLYERERDRFDGSETVWDLFNAFTHVVSHESRRLQDSSRLVRLDRLNELFSRALAPSSAIN